MELIYCSLFHRDDFNCWKQHMAAYVGDRARTHVFLCVLQHVHSPHTVIIVSPTESLVNNYDETCYAFVLTTNIERNPIHLNC